METLGLGLSLFGALVIGVSTFLSAYYASRDASAAKGRIVIHTNLAKIAGVASFFTGIALVIIAI